MPGCLDAFAVAESVLNALQAMLNAGEMNQAAAVAARAAALSAAEQVSPGSLHALDF